MGSETITRDVHNESDGEVDVCASPDRVTSMVLTIDDQDYKFAPVGSMLRVKIQEHLSDEKDRLWKDVIDLSKDLGDIGSGLLKDAYRLRLAGVTTSITEVIHYLSSPAGDRWWFGLSIKPFNKGLSEEDIDHAYDRTTLQQMEQFRNFQYSALNPEDSESVVQAARTIQNSLGTIPEKLREDISLVCRTVMRDVTDYLV